MTFLCKECNYVTEIECNYKKHLKSAKHSKCIQNIVNSKNNFECEKCDKKFKYSQGLSRHKKTCTQQNNNIIQPKLLETFMKEFIDMKEEINKIKIINDKLVQDKIEKLESNEKYLKSLINEAGSLTKTSVSALAYVTKNYCDAPILQSLKSDDYIMLNHSEDDETNLVNVLIYYHRHGSIAKYFGDFIVKMYKTNNPQNQSLWSSDVARLNYIIRTVTGNDESIWLTDKNGIKIKDTIVVPMLNYINDKISSYTKEKSKEIALCTSSGVIEILNKIAVATEISKDIDSGLIAKDIIKYIAPHFSVDGHILLK